MIVYPPFNLTIEGDLIRSEYSLIWEPIYEYVYILYTDRSLILEEHIHNTQGPPLIFLIGHIDASRILIQILGATLISIALTFIFKSVKT